MDEQLGLIIQHIEIKYAILQGDIMLLTSPSEKNKDCMIPASTSDWGSSMRNGLLCAPTAHKNFYRSSPTLASAN